MHPNPRRIIPIVLLLGLAGYGVWSWWNGRAVAAGPVQASGTIETTEVNVAPVAQNQRVSTAEDAAKGITLAATDGK